MYVVNLATAIELSCMHAQSINFNNLLSNIFSNEKGRKFHLTCISWSDMNIFIQFHKCLYWLSCYCSNEWPHSTCANCKTIASAEKTNKNRHVDLFICKCKWLFTMRQRKFCKIVKHPAENWSYENASEIRSWIDKREVNLYAKAKIICDIVAMCEAKLRVDLDWSCVYSRKYHGTSSVELTAIL